MTTLREAAQQALRAAEQGATVSCICILRAALAEPDLSRCPSCGGPADNGHDRSIPPNPYFCSKCMDEPVVGIIEPRIKGDSHQTLDDAMQQTRAMAQAYESGYKAGAAAEREAIIQTIPGGHIVDPQWVCDIIRARSNT